MDDAVILETLQKAKYLSSYTPGGPTDKLFDEPSEEINT
jgi:hypothetical protein